MRAIVQNVCIRGCEKKHSDKSGKDYLLVRFEDVTAKPCELVDRDLSREPYYTRNTEGDLHIDITSGKYTNISIIDFKIAQ